MSEKVPEWRRLARELEAIARRLREADYKAQKRDERRTQSVELREYRRFIASLAANGAKAVPTFRQWQGRDR